MPKKPKAARLTDKPMSIRIPADLRDRIDALARGLPLRGVTP